MKRRHRAREKEREEREREEERGGKSEEEREEGRRGVRQPQRTAQGQIQKAGVPLLTRRGRSETAEQTRTEKKRKVMMIVGWWGWWGEWVKKRGKETARSGIEKEEERRVERLGSGREKERHYAFRTTPKPQPPSRTAAEKGECTQAWATAIKVHEWGSLRRHEAGQSRTERKQKEEKYETREERVGMGVGWDGVWVKGEIEKRKIETSCFRSTPRHLQPPSHTAAGKGGNADMGDGTTSSRTET